MKKQNGITLIALVITIIVMLILVGVTITMALNGGLFGYAKEGAAKTGSAKDEESEIASGNIVKQWVNGTGSSGGITEDDEPIEVCKHSFTDEDCEICGFTAPNIGDYIYGYNPIIGENGETIETTYTSTSDKNGSGNYEFEVSSIENWRYLKADSEERMLITTVDPVNTKKNELLSLSGELGYVNLIDELNKICSIYGQAKYADKTAVGSVELTDLKTITTGGRSITVEDLGWTSTRTSGRTFTRKNGILNSAGSSVKSEFSYYDEENKIWTSLEDGESVTIIGYSYGGTYSDINLFYGSNGEVCSFWEANRDIYISSIGCQFGVRNNNSFNYLISSDGQSMGYSKGCRPVVTLKSDILLTYSDGKYNLTY